MYLKSETEKGNIWHLYAMEGDKVYGFLDAEVDEGDIFIDCIYVEEPFRRRGIGDALLDQVCSVLKDNELPFGVNVTYAMEDRLDSLDAFMCSRADFMFEEDCMEYRISPKQWRESKLIEKFRKAGISAKRLGEMARKQMAELEELFSRYDLEIMPEEGSIYDYYEPELSSVIFEQDDMKAALMARVLPEEKIVEISAMVCDKDIYPKFVGVLSAFTEAYERKYGDYDVRFLALNGSSKAFADRIFAKSGDRVVFKTAVWLGM